MEVIGGAKCDVCGYISEGTTLEDVKKLIDAPCPVCGTVMITQQDYETAKTLLEIAGMIEEAIPGAKDGPKVSLGVEISTNKEK